jgi:hypothetical protein
MDKHPTVDELRELISSCDDLSGHHVLWVAKNGDVYVSQIPRDKTPIGFEEANPNMQLRCETFVAGNEYVGPEAAKDDEWLNQLFQTLEEEWPHAKRQPRVEYIDQF